MPSPLEAAGAAIQPTATASLHSNEFFTGLWTNGSPFGPGAVPYIYAKFYGATRYERLVGGNDCEISTRLTPIRRPGHSVYNSSLFPPINRFYEFRGFNLTDEVIRLLADCDAPTNPVGNPNFDSGSTNWIIQPGWSVVSGVRPDGSTGNMAQWNGHGALFGHGLIQNLTHIPCTPGMLMSAQCWAKGEPGVLGTTGLSINWFDAGGGLISQSSGPSIPANNSWISQMTSAIAPAGCASCGISYAVTGGTSGGTLRWFASNFTVAFGAYANAATVREATQPTTNNILWSKDPAAGRTSFVSDGNVLYAGDGVNTHQWVTSAKSWQPNAVYQPGDFIIDSNGNLQMAVGSVTATIVNIQVDVVALGGGVNGRKVTLWFNSSTPFDVPSNIRITTAGLTTVPAANETTPYTVQVESTLQCSWVEATTAIPATGYTTETGTVTTGIGVSDIAAPVWNTTQGLVTQDGTLQWVNMGFAVLPWGAPGPTTAPTISQAVAPTIYPPWAANTFYAPQGNFSIVDSNGNLEQVIVGGQTAPGSPPTFPTGVGAITVDGSVRWQNQGPAFWQSSHNYVVGNAVKVTYNYTTTTYQWTSDGHGGFIQVPVQTQVTATSFFQVITAGMSGLNPPAWNNGVGVITKEASGLTWRNLGNVTLYPGASQKISIAPTILDPNGFLQNPTNQGQSGAAPPATWGATLGALTVDNSETWINGGAYATAATAPWQWAYSGKNSITGMISNASPVNIPFTPSVNNAPIIQGAGMDAPWDTIVLWRTAAGGSTLLYDDEFPNPGPGQVWIYTDTNLDPGGAPTAGQGMLNQLITAPINNTSDPPPADFVPQAYYLGRIFGYSLNLLRWTGGPDTVTGNGNTTMPPVNQFRLPSKGVLCWPTSVGLICFTTTDIWALLGQGTDASPFYVVNFQQGIGMASQDAFGVNGSTAYAMLTSHQVVSIDPGAGELEIGFPIADLFDNVMNPSQVYITWHQGRSADTALYVANGTQFWYRMSAVSAPESGNVWSPVATIQAPGKVRAMASIEITPGEKKLILGPNVDGNPILMRDSSVHTDNGVAYSPLLICAPVTLAQPGSTAGMQFVVTEEKLLDGASPCTVSMLFDEFLDFTHIGMADLRALRNITNDPPNLPKQKSVRTQRLWGTQDPSTVIKCRFYQQVIGWPAEDYPNELYTNTVYGRLPEKARK